MEISILNLLFKKIINNKVNSTNHNHYNQFIIENEDNIIDSNSITTIKL